MFSGTPTQTRSLAEVHESVPTNQPAIWRRMLAFAGPAYLISVGYMDPGNWASDIVGGASFGYKLLWVLVMSNLMAVLLQTLSARLGIVTGRDLAQACRESYPRAVNLALWLLCEIAIVACDLAEVLGAAIALNLLFNIPLLAGVALTSLDTLLVLGFQKAGIRYFEAFILALVVTIAACFTIEIILAKPDYLAVATGLIPTIDRNTLYVAVAMLGATVMPHNLYLHSALVQTRRIGRSVEEKRAACRFNLIDCVLALNGAMFVNGAILILAGTVFFRAHKNVTEIQQAYELLTPLMGTVLASKLFGVALLASGQSSTLTGTMAGQIVMEGFLNIRVRPWLRRLVTRALAIIPACIAISLAGSEGTLQLLVLSQVVLNLQLPFAIIPLLQFTNDRNRMGEFASGWKIRAAGWVTAVVVLGLNIWLAAQTILEWGNGAGRYAPLVWILSAVICIGLLVLLGAVTLQPFRHDESKVATLGVEQQTRDLVTVQRYRRILVPLDHSRLDRLTLSHAAGIAQRDDARVYLLHVEEGVTSQMYGSESSTAEVEAGRKYLDRLVSALTAMNIDVETAIRHGSRPRTEIVAYAREINADLLVMGAHGHRRLKDLIFGTTIDPVRHALKVPILVVREEP
ncbi:MAG TPA: Nramp family divalent metal transporter [Bryobacteraceae bacterium]|nr:Nramp family divalent metal transporter [Bryobacteraceae bacterium]